MNSSTAASPGRWALSMKLYTIPILLFFPVILIGQTARKINCDPIISSSDLHNIIKQVINLRQIDTNCLLISHVESLESGTTDLRVLKGFIKPQNPAPNHSWAELDSNDVNYMLCNRRKYKRLEWNPRKLGLPSLSSKTAISFSFPYVSRNGKIIILGYKFYGLYSSENSYVFDGGYTLAIIKDGDKISIEELTRSIR